jgi:hypothetical protein
MVGVILFLIEQSSMKSDLQTQHTLTLVQTLTRDALALLAEDLRKQIRKQMKSLVEDAKSPSTTYVVSKIYDTGIEDAAIPEIIYYEGFKNIDNIESRILKGKSNFKDPEKLYRDQYNLALNLLVNLWLTNLKKSDAQIQKIPKRGIYLRDSTGELYLHQEE